MEWKDAEWWLRLINKMLNKIWSKNVGLDESAAHGKDASSCLVGTAPTPAAVHKGGFILCFLSSFLLLKYSTSIQLSMTFLSSWQLVCKCVIGSHTYPSFVTLQKSNETIPKSIWHIYFVHIWMDSSLAIRTFMRLGLLGDNDDQKRRMWKPPSPAAKDPL